MVDGRHVCPFSSWYLPVRYASSASVTRLVCSAREFTETTLWVILTEYIFQCTKFSGCCGYYMSDCEFVSLVPRPRMRTCERVLVTMRHFTRSYDIDVWNVGWPIRV